jgi:glycosyltransferase involved in cell wall biosynthesis
MKGDASNPAVGVEPGLVSVIMPAYNAEAYMARSIESVLAQTRSRLELIVVDDCSTDGTFEGVSEKAALDDRIRLHRLPKNAGVAAARNAGIERARGEYVAFLDSDDWWHPRKLELQIAQMQAHDATVSYCAFQRVGEDGRLLSRVDPPPTLTHADMLRSNFIGNLTGVYARSLGPAEFIRMGHEDYVFWLQMIRRSGTARRIEFPESLAFYLVREGSVSANKLRAAGWQWRIYRDIEHLSLLRAAWYMGHYLWNALAKRR